MKDLTTGNEARLIFYFALPMLIGNVFQQLYNVIDSIIVGQFLGKNALAAVGAGFPIVFLMISLVMGITMGSTVIISQYYGAGDMEMVKRAIGTTHIFILIASVIITLTGIFLSEFLLRLMNTPEEILPDAVTYLHVMFAGSLLLFGYNSIAAILRGLGDSKTPLYFLIISTIINAALVLIFVLVFGWGVFGAGLATVFAQGVAFGLGILYLVRSSHDVLKLRISNIVFDRTIFINSIKIGLPAGIQQTLVSLGMMAVATIVNRFGTDVIAAYTAAGRLDSFAMMPAMNLSMALSTFTGQNLGAGRNDRVRNGLRATLVISSIISISLTAVIIGFRYQLMAVFNSDVNVINYGAEYLVIVSSFYILFSIMFSNNGILRGAGDTVVPMFITLLALWAVRIPVAALLAEKIGVQGIWWGIPAGWAVGALLSTVYYKIGRWKSRVLVKKEMLNESALSI